MKLFITVLLLLQSMLAFSTDNICEEKKEESLTACKIANQRCNAHRPGSYICMDILFNCTDKVYQKYEECLVDSED